MLTGTMAEFFTFEQLQDWDQCGSVVVPPALAKSDEQ